MLPVIVDIIGKNYRICIEKKEEKGMYCTVCGTEMIGGKCPKCEKSEKKILSSNGRVLDSPAPIDDGLRRLNWLYYVAGGILLALFIFGKERSIFGFLFLGAFFFLIAFTLKHIIAKDLLALKLPKIEFALPENIDEQQIVGKITMPLTAAGMTVEKNSNGYPVITYHKVKYSVYIDSEKSNFRIDSDKSFFSFSGIKLYRKVVIAMGIIAYTIQQEALK